MLFIDIIIVVTLLLLATAIAVALWAAWRTTQERTSPATNRRLPIAIAGGVALLLIAGALLLPVNTNVNTTEQRLANMFILTIGVMLVAAISIAARDTLHKRKQ